MLCNSCHSKNGIAKDKIPTISSHPEATINNRGRNVKERLNYFPLFHKNYGEPITRGNVSCPSCHDAHQWGPGINIKGKGINMEGDATNSFLRSRSSILPCMECHGPDALFRYKYYHKAKARKGKYPVKR
jgi:cytochrome c553